MSFLQYPIYKQVGAYQLIRWKEHSIINYDQTNKVNDKMICKLAFPFLKTRDKLKTSLHPSFFVFI